MSTKRFTLLCNGKFWREFDSAGPWVNALPENVFIYCRDGTFDKSKWLDKSLRAVPVADLPPEIRTLALLLDLT